MVAGMNKGRGVWRSADIKPSRRRVVLTKQNGILAAVSFDMVWSGFAYRVATDNGQLKLVENLGDPFEHLGMLGAESSVQLAKRLKWVKRREPRILGVPLSLYRSEVPVSLFWPQRM